MKCPGLYGCCVYCGPVKWFTVKHTHNINTKLTLADEQTQACHSREIAKWKQADLRLWAGDPENSGPRCDLQTTLTDPRHQPGDLGSGDGWVPGRGVKADECVSVCADSAWLHALAAVITENGKMKAFTVWLVSLFTRTERSAEQPSINKPLFLSGQSAMFQHRKWHQQTELRFTRGRCHDTCWNGT